MRSFTLALVATLLLAPLAHAQGPLPAQPTPVYTVVIQNAPAAFTGLEAANATSSAPFQVVLTLGNVVCAQQAVIPVTITTTATGAPPFFTVAPEPSVINFTIDAGPHGNPPVGTAGGGTGDSAAVARIAGNITVNASVQVTVQASAPPPTGCQGAGNIAAATSDPVVIFANLTAETPPPPPPPPAEDTPFVGVLALAAVAVAVALARRRKG